MEYAIFLQILFFKNGELVDKFVGAASKDKLDEKFKTLL